MYTLTMSKNTNINKIYQKTKEKLFKINMFHSIRNFINFMQSKYKEYGSNMEEKYCSVFKFLNL